MSNYLLALLCFKQAFLKVPFFWNFFRTCRLSNDEGIKKGVADTLSS